MSRNARLRVLRPPPDPRGPCSAVSPSRLSARRRPDPSRRRVPGQRVHPRLSDRGGGGRVRRRRLHDRLERSGRQRVRRLPPSLLERRHTVGERVPGQRLHDVGSAESSARDGGERRLRRRLAGPRPGRLGLRRLRPPLLERGSSAHGRVPGQHLHRRSPARRDGRRGCRRRLRRGLGQQSPGRRRRGHFRPPFLEHGPPLASRVPGQHLHHGAAGRGGGGDGRRRRLRRGLAELLSGWRRTTASSRGALPARAPRSPASSRSTPTHRASSTPQRWRRRATATS